MSDPRLQGPGRNNDPGDFAGLVQQLVELKRQVNDLSGSILKAAGIQALPGKIASTDWDGTDHGALGSVGWVLGRDGAGASYLALNGTDIADLISTSSTSRYDSSSADGMAFGNTEAAAYTGPVLSIPAIYKRVVVMCIAGIRATNTTGSAIYLFGRPRIESSTGDWAVGATLQTAISAGWQGTVSSPEVYGFTFPGMAGQTLTFKAMGWTSTAVAATASNFAGYSYIALMTRG